MVLVGLTCRPWPSRLPSSTSTSRPSSQAIRRPGRPWSTAPCGAWPPGSCTSATTSPRTYWTMPTVAWLPSSRSPRTARTGARYRDPTGRPATRACWWRRPPYLRCRTSRRCSTGVRRYPLGIRCACATPTATAIRPCPTRTCPGPPRSSWRSTTRSWICSVGYCGSWPLGWAWTRATSTSCSGTGRPSPGPFTTRRWTWLPATSTSGRPSTATST